MEILRPVAVDTAARVSTTLLEDAADWAAGSYSTGAVVDHEDHVWESLINSNTAEPGTDPEKWLDLGANNVWALYDQAVASQSVADDEIEEVLELPSLVDMILLQNVSAAEVQVTVTDDVEGVVFDETRSLIADEFIDNWLSYFTEPFVRETEALFTDLPPYVGAPITISIRDEGNEVAVGLILPGLSLDMGGTRWEPEVGIDDYSRKETDDFGNVTIVERGFAKRARFSVWAARDRVGFLQDKMAQYRATPLAFIGSRSDRVTWVYGYYSSFNFVIAYPEVAVFDLEVRGLV